MNDAWLLVAFAFGVGVGAAGAAIIADVRQERQIARIVADVKRFGRKAGILKHERKSDAD